MRIMLTVHRHGRGEAELTVSGWFQSPPLDGAVDLASPTSADRFPRPQTRRYHPGAHTDINMAPVGDPYEAIVRGSTSNIDTVIVDGRPAPGPSSRPGSCQGLATVQKRARRYAQGVSGRRIRRTGRQHRLASKRKVGGRDHERRSTPERLALSCPSCRRPSPTICTIVSPAIFCSWPDRGRAMRRQVATGKVGAGGVG